MKKSEQKHAAWINKQATKRKRKYGMAMIMLVMLFSIVTASAMYVQNDISLSDIGKTAAPVTTATVMGTVGSIERVSNKERAGKAVKDKLFLLSADQVDESVPFPTRIGVSLANIPLKSGEYWHYVRSVIDSPEIKTTGEDGDNATTIKNSISFVVGGLPDKLLTLIEEGLGEAFYVGFERCTTGEKYLIGSGCKPLQMKAHDGGFTKDFTGITLNFENQDGITFSKYTGNFALQPPDTVPADATTITLTSNDQYQLTDGSAAVVDITGFSAVTDTDINRVVTLFGCVGSPAHAPQIPSGNDFLLQEGTTWVADPGKSISFKIFKDASAGFKYIEVAGSRT